MKKKIHIGCLILIVVCLIIGSTLSVYKFKVINPISSGLAMIQIMKGNKEFIEVQKIPYKVVFINNNIQDKSAYLILKEYMKNRNFTEDENERMGATLVYSNNKTTEKVNFTINQYLCLCVWK